MKTNLFKTFAALAVLTAGSALAADLPRFLPAETLFAVGVEGLAQHEEKARPFIEEWERLDLSNLLEAAFADELAEGDDAMPDIDADFLDLLGGEAWLVVSASQFNPLPTVTLMATVTPAGMAAFHDLLAELEAEGEVSQGTEGSITFTTIVPSTEDPVPPVVVHATFEDVVLVTTNPDVARGVLRRFQGAQEPSLATNVGFLGTIGALRAGNLYSFLDLPAATAVATPFAASMGFDGLVGRLSDAAGTAGVYGTVTSLTDQGFDSLGVRVMGSRDSDPILYDLLAGQRTVGDDVLAFVPRTAVGVSASVMDLPGWWSWLEDVVASEPQIGIDDLDQIVADMAGIDLQSSLFGWMTGEVGVVTLGYGDPAAMPTDLTDPLGAVAYLIAADDVNAASQGLEELLGVVTGFASSFMDPMGQGAPVEPNRRQVGGVEVTDWFLAEGFALSVAATDGFVILATTPATMDEVLSASAGTASLPLALAPLQDRVPASVRSFTLTDDRAALAYSAETMVQQLGMMSGITGGDVDFDAVEAATSALGEFLAFVAERFEGSVGHTNVDGAVVRSEGYSFVSW